MILALSTGSVYTVRQLYPSASGAHGGRFLAALNVGRERQGRGVWGISPVGLEGESTSITPLKYTLRWSGLLLLRGNGSRRGQLSPGLGLPIAAGRDATWQRWQRVAVCVFRRGGTGTKLQLLASSTVKGDM
ncbi:hypothetical protein SKAU_G00025040 [Synaphobranchus kaupii]|uniref:Uncharacterized protein n=1 Tax=Synaphobranchus kaupii TaxID=118154 RepID=A0A9Q1GDU7_SYNKA|nr:hypothetical protein SKAU_G00025040 [Synaphobranchus kaupii]